MNALLKKIGLKQKFFIIFFTVTLFASYQIISDTILTAKQQQTSFVQQSEQILFSKHLNHYLYTFQNHILELRSKENSAQEQKIFILQKTEKLLKELVTMTTSFKNKEDYIVIEQSLEDIIKNMHILSYEQILDRYNIIYEKLFFNSTALPSFISSENLNMNLLKLVHTNNAFILYQMHKEAFLNQLNSIEPIFFKALTQNHKQLNTYLNDKQTLKTLKSLQDQLKNYKSTNADQKPFKIIYELIQTYITINQILMEQVYNELKLQQEQIDDNFNIKLFVEIIALILTLVLLSYFYKSLFIYIRKIQNAHRIKSIFLSNMSHELRTPLNAIIGFLNILKESNDEKEQKKFVDIIYKSSKQLLYIINDILDFSKIEDAKLKIENKPFNIQQEFDLLIELFSANASSKNITLQKEFSTDVPECIISDKFRLKQILSNLISNAIKFTHEGGLIKIIVKKKNQKLFLCVEDNGIGISKKAQKSIFKSFLQADESTARKFGGTGLGLSISSKLVNLLGSKLKVQSKELYGSKFYFYLPIKECKKKHKEIKNQETFSTYSGKVLLVEDNPTNQFLMQITFSNLKLDVILANDGVEAIERFKNNEVDLVFMDDNMPNKNGVEAAMEIIEYEKQHQLKHTPIIALTANTGSDAKKRLLKSGMDEYMAKPFDIKLLHQILQKYLT